MVSDKTRNVLGGIGLLMWMITATILLTLKVCDRVMQMQQLQQMQPVDKCSCDMCHEPFEGGRVGNR